MMRCQHDIPVDKARAVVDAMERDMGTTLAHDGYLLLKQEFDLIGRRWNSSAHR
jgi:hypothetical protein